MNSCVFTGRAGSTAETRKTQGGQSVANFSLAVDRQKKGGEKQAPLWLRVSLWGKTAENLAQYITKGKQLSVSGSVDLQTYETRDGEKRTEIVLSAQNVTLLGGGQENQEREPGDEKQDYGF